LVPTHSTDAPFRRLAVNQFVVESLMIPLAMVVGDKFRTTARRWWRYHPRPSRDPAIDLVNRL